MSGLLEGGEVWGAEVAWAVVVGGDIAKLQRASRHTNNSSVSRFWAPYPPVCPPSTPSTPLPPNPSLWCVRAKKMFRGGRIGSRIRGKER